MATTLTPAQQQALQGFVDYVKTKTSTPASTSQTQGVASLASTPATTSQTQGVASLNTQPWWVGQFASEADANFVDTNRNQQIEETERAAWRSQYDPKSTEYKLRSSTDTYIDPIEGKDYTDRLTPYLAKQLTDLGITDFGQIEKQIIKGDPAKVELGPTEYLFEMPTSEWSTGLFRSGPDGYEAINQDQYEIGQRQAVPLGGDGFGGYTTVAARRKIAIDATPDVTKYYNKNTGQEITNRVLFDDKAGTKYVLTDQGVQKEFDPTTRLAVQLRSYIDPSSTGGAWGTKAGKSSGPGFGPEGMMNQIAQRVQGATGVSDINDFELKTVTKPRGVAVTGDSSGRFFINEGGQTRYLTDEEVKTIRSEDYVYGDGMTGTTFYADVNLPTKGIYNKKTGQLIADQGSSSSFLPWRENSAPTIYLGGWGEGPGITYASMTFDANGKPKISTYGEDTNTLSQIQPLMTLASIIPSPIQPFAIAANAANAAYNYGNFAPAILAAAGYSGILDSIAGTAANVAGSAGELASNSGIAGLAQDLGVSADLANKIGRVGAQSGLSGTISAAQGKGFDTGFTSGLASGLVKEGVNELSAATGLDKGLGSLAGPTKSLVSSALTSAALDRPFDFSEAAKTAATRYGVGEISKLVGLTPEQGRAVNSFLEYLGKKK